MLLERRDSYTKYSPSWNQAQQKIDDLIAEGKDKVVCHLRERLINATKANDETERDKIAELIRLHVRKTDPWRFHRGWLKKG